MPFERPHKELLRTALLYAIKLSFALLFVLLVLVAANCFGEISYISPFAHWIREHTKLIWVPVYYIGWVMDPFQPIIAPLYSALCVRAWKGGRLLPMLIQGNTLFMHPVSDLISLIYGGKRKWGNWTLAGVWIGILGLVGAELLGWGWDWGLFDLLGVPGEKKENYVHGEVEKGENGTELRSEKVIGEIVEQDAKLIDI